MKADFSLDYDVLTVERPQKLYLMARFSAGSASNNYTRRPLNISLVIDRSGSMAGAKMDYTRQAAQFLVQHLGAKDILSIVLYNDRVETLVSPDVLHNKDAVAQLIEGVRVSGTTNLSGGWLEGCQHVLSKLNTSYLNRVILMSDGLANRGVTETPQLVQMAKQKHEQGVSTTTMGLGTDFNEDLLMEMANGGGGAFYFIESPEVAPEIFREELSGLLNVVGQNLTITITPNSDVKSLKQLNMYPMHTNGIHTTFNVGDIFADELKTLVLELNIPALSALGEKQIALLRFEYDEILDQQSNHQTFEVPVMIRVRPNGELPPPPDLHVTQSVLLLQAAQARNEAVKYADDGDFLGASQVLRVVAQAIDMSMVKNDVLLEEQNALLEQATKMDSGAKTYDEYSRKTMSTQAYYTSKNRHEDTVMLRLREIKRAQKETQEEIMIVTPQANTSNDLVQVEEGVTPTHATWRDKTFALKGDLIRIGRAGQNEIVIDEKGMSRFHAQIKREGDTLFIEDLGSTNGTSVGGEKIQAAHQLSVGDVVYLCDEKLIFKRLDKAD
jgi:Ca-activated chloride channel homolog